ncbi:MAG: hypothetical protein MUP70_08315 [Candidatus Aminicenantes bacterium]|nr:hypothetical protein [Candidatus Aminicenantes bacterium]
MNRTTKISIMVLCVLLSAISREITADSLSPSNPDIMKYLLGEWDVETEGRQYQFVFKFYMEDDQLMGLYSGTTGIYTMQNLTIEKDTAYFFVEIKASPNNLALDFEATIDEDSLYGFLSLEHGISAIMGSKKGTSP